MIFLLIINLCINNTKTLVKYKLYSAKENKLVYERN